MNPLMIKAAGNGNGGRSGNGSGTCKVKTCGLHEVSHEAVVTIRCLSAVPEELQALLNEMAAASAAPTGEAANA
jgi:hypothetical protein